MSSSLERFLSSTKRGGMAMGTLVALGHIESLQMFVTMMKVNFTSASYSKISSFSIKLTLF